MKDTGCIYILTNPSFPDYVKIGYATNLEKRLKQLNRSETIPFAFRAYAIYEVDKPLTDKELHKLIDRLNPDLRTQTDYRGRRPTEGVRGSSPGRPWGQREARGINTGICTKKGHRRQSFGGLRPGLDMFRAQKRPGLCPRRHKSSFGERFAPFLFPAAGPDRTHPK